MLSLCVCHFFLCRIYRLHILFISNYIDPLISYPINAFVSFFFSRHVAFIPFHFNSLQTQHPIDTINHNRNQNMGLCSSSNIRDYELNPLTAEEVQEKIAAKLGVAVDEIVSHILSVLYFCLVCDVWYNQIRSISLSFFLCLFLLFVLWTFFDIGLCWTRNRFSSERIRWSYWKRIEIFVFNERYTYCDWWLWLCDY